MGGVGRAVSRGSGAGEGSSRLGSLPVGRRSLGQPGVLRDSQQQCPGLRHRPNLASRCPQHRRELPAHPDSHPHLQQIRQLLLCHQPVTNDHCSGQGHAPLVVFDIGSPGGLVERPSRPAGGDRPFGPQPWDPRSSLNSREASTARGIEATSL